MANITHLRKSKIPRVFAVSVSYLSYGIIVFNTGRIFPHFSSNCLSYAQCHDHIPHIFKISLYYKHDLHYLNQVFNNTANVVLLYSVSQSPLIWNVVREGAENFFVCMCVCVWLCRVACGICFLTRDGTCTPCMEA